MTVYRKKPVVIHAVQWSKPGDHPAVEAYDPVKAGAYIKGVGPYGWVKTLEGGHIVSPGDWIICGVKGEHYPCKPDIFEMTYEIASPSGAGLGGAVASSEAVEALKWCAAALQALIDSRGESGAISMIVSGEKKSLEEVLDMADAALASQPGCAVEGEAVPIDMVLHCPMCGLQHIDAPEDAECDGEVVQSTGWSNPPHKSHLCHGHDCNHIWRPADVPTNGVRAIKTTGKADSPIRAALQVNSTEMSEGAKGSRTDGKEAL